MVNSNIICTINHPLDGTPIQVRCDEALLEYWAKNAPKRLWNVRTAIQVLTRPNVIYDGLDRDEVMDGWCIVGKPAKWYTDENEMIDFPQDKVYAVFLNDRFAMYTHRPEDEDPIDFLHIIDWQNRFTNVIYDRRKLSK